MRKLCVIFLALMLATTTGLAQTTPPSSSTSAAPSAQQGTPPSQPTDQPSQTAPSTPAPDTGQQTNPPVLEQRSSAQATSTQGANVIPAGAQIKAVLDQALSTKTSKPGDQFTATISEAVRDANGNVVVPAGAKVHGEVTESEPGKALPEVRGKGRLNMRFRNLELSNGATVPLTASLVSVHSTSKSGGGSTGKEGEVTSGRSGTQTAKGIGIGAGIGTVAGLIFGHALRGLAIGAIAGGGYVLATQGKDVDLPAETGLALRTDQDTPVPANTGGS